MSSDAESSILMYVNYMYIYTVPGGYLSLSAFLFAFLPSDFGFATLFSFQTEVRRLRSLILSKKVPKCICCFNYIYFLRQYFQISTFMRKRKKRNGLLKCLIKDVGRTNIWKNESCMLT